MELKDFLQQTAAATEACLEQLLPIPSGLEARLHLAMRYSVLAGGKRLRPALFLATLKACADGLETARENYLPFAAALELIHSYSLIHDDLPAMDNDDMRRGRPTCHKAFDEATAILAGDALLTLAFSAMLNLKDQVSPARLLDAMAEVAWAAGPCGMVAGQMADMALEGQQPSLRQLQEMARGKTGALFTASILSAAHLAGASPPQMQALRKYSEHLGISFQIADDILDITGDPGKLGKPVGSDEKNSKATFVSLLGLKEASILARQTAEQAADLLSAFDERAHLLRQFPHMLLRRDN